MKKLLTLILTAVLCLCCLASCGILGFHPISYQDAKTERLLMEGYAPKRAKPGDTVVLRTGPIMDANLYLYANGVPIENTHNDSDYWEYTFIMPDEDVVITHKMSDGFIQPNCERHIDQDANGICDYCGHRHTIYYLSEKAGHFINYTCGCSHDAGMESHYDENIDCICDACGYDMNEDYPPLVDETISLRNLTGCAWLNEINAEDIAEIKIIGEAVGVAPGNLKNIWGSTDEAVIARIFEEYYCLDTRTISKMDGQIDEETKLQRRDELMELQQEISLDLNEKAVGRRMQVLIEGYVPNEQVYIGRGYGDAPDVDGYIFASSEENLETGDFVTVRITGSSEYDLMGECCPDHEDL
jgi:hypothetical protein